MRLVIVAVGRLRSGPELDLFDNYRSRFERTGRPLALGPLALAEVESRKGSSGAAEAPLLDAAVPRGAVRIMLDERGKQLSSPEFANHIADWRDQGRGEAAFVIGGADGLDRSLRDKADLTLSFGPMVWPHLLIRAMLAEQLYRAASILAGTPYHRA
ncbi:MAG: 23S rRNA (pseudouridine(1915)-N(3))-methyltransferase RlmH [Pseudomonadota bacterium]